mmetsp:Transcript_44262/g.132136  ORF Transcript_44262/g.132136 Transcript_44262/m.132136 type:complete len:219 (+) Transcript_44262:361-1017(+)
MHQDVQASHQSRSRGYAGHGPVHQLRGHILQGSHGTRALQHAGGRCLPLCRRGVLSGAYTPGSPQYAGLRCFCPHVGTVLFGLKGVGSRQHQGDGRLSELCGAGVPEAEQAVALEDERHRCFRRTPREVQGPATCAGGQHTGQRHFRDPPCAELPETRVRVFQHHEPHGRLRQHPGRGAAGLQDPEPRPDVGHRRVLHQPRALLQGPDLPVPCRHVGI